MPRSEPAISALPARLRRLQAQLPELPAETLLRLRHEVQAALLREPVRGGDVASILRIRGRD